MASPATTNRSGPILEDHVVADRYRVERRLGEGRSGSVHLATHLVTGKHVVLKCMQQSASGDADDVERFVREAEIAALVRHPNVIDIYDVGYGEGTVFLVMEYLRGVSLQEFLDRHGTLSARLALALFLPALRGLCAVHDKGLVHRDLKPSNLFVTLDEEGEPSTLTVLDFGIAKRLEEAGEALTRTGAVVGTPHYIAPEQAEDARRVDARADVYGIGVTLYRCFAGRPPFEAENLPALLLRVSKGDAVPLSTLRPDLPTALCKAVMRAMATDPRKRFASMRALAEALEAVPLDGTTDRLARRRAGGLALLGLGLAAAAWMAVSWGPAREASPASPPAHSQSGSAGELSLTKANETPPTAEPAAVRPFSNPARNVPVETPPTAEPLPAEPVLDRSAQVERQPQPRPDAAKALRTAARRPARSQRKATDAAEPSGRDPEATRPAPADTRLGIRLSPAQF